MSTLTMSDRKSLYAKFAEAQKQSRIWTAVRIAALFGLGIIAMFQQDVQFYATIYWTILICYELMYGLSRKDMLSQLEQLSPAPQGDMQSTSRN